MSSQAPGSLQVRRLTGEAAAHWRVYGRGCCVTHLYGEPEEQTEAAYVVWAKKHEHACCLRHDPATVVLETTADLLVQTLAAEYQQGYRLVAITGPFDHLGRFYKFVLEPIHEEG